MFFGGSALLYWQHILVHTMWRIKCRKHSNSTLYKGTKIAEPPKITLWSHRCQRRHHNVLPCQPYYLYYQFGSENQKLLNPHDQTSKTPFPTKNLFSPYRYLVMQLQRAVHFMYFMIICWFFFFIINSSQLALETEKKNVELELSCWTVFVKKICI